MNWLGTLLGPCIAVAACLSLAASAFSAPLNAENSIETRSIDFVRDIQPIFENHCAECHKPSKHDGDLRLDGRQFLVQGGDSRQNLLRLPIERNELVRRITCVDPAERMPLGAPALDAESVRAIATWIEQGAVWPVRKIEELRRSTQQTLWDRLQSAVVDRYEAWHG